MSSLRRILRTYLFDVFIFEMCVLICCQVVDAWNLCRLPDAEAMEGGFILRSRDAK